MISTELLLDTALRGAAVVVMTALLVRGMGRGSPVLRHVIWSAALTGVLLLPLLARVIPWRLPVLPVAPAAELARDMDPAESFAPAPAPAGASEPSHPAAPPPSALPEPAATAGPAWQVPWARVLPAVWLGGVLLLTLRLLAGFGAVGRITRRAEELDAGDWQDALTDGCRRLGVATRPRLMISDEIGMPCTTGWRRPVIVLPGAARDWDSGRRDLVLLHELAHVRRRDIVTHCVGQLACALHWFNPLVWMAARRLRAEAERACDGLVLVSGARASDYASHLLDIVRGSPPSRHPAAVVPFALRSEFEGRLLAILESKGIAMPTPRASRLAAGVVLAALVPIAALGARPAAMAAPVEEAGGAGALSRPAAGTDLRASVAALAQALGDPVPEVRRAAAEAIGSLADTAGVQALIEVLRRDPDAGVRRAAAWSLGQMEDRRAVPALVAALRGDTDLEVRRNAAEALGSIEDPAAVPALAEALRRERDGSVRQAVIEALGSIEAPDSWETVVPALRDPDPEIRRAAAEALGSIEHAGAVADLMPLVRDSDVEVRRAAVDALGSIEDRRALPALVRALSDTDVEVRRAAVDAIGSLEELRQAPPELMRALQDSDAEVRRGAVHAIGSIEDPAGVGPLVALLKDPDVEIRRAVVEALEDIEDATATAALREALRDSDSEVRRMAARALGSRSR